MGEPRPQNEPGPYVISAIDYHFHDAHPSDPISLDEAVEFASEANNIHNVTFEGAGYSENLRAGETLTIDPLSSLVEVPGRYRFFCKFHVDRGMKGVLVVTG